MKKIILSVLFTFLLLNITFAEPITQKKATEVAQKFFTYKTAGKKSVEIRNIFSTQEKGLITFYTVNFEDGGFVIVSGDDRVKPVLAYSENSYAPENITNTEIRYWLDNYSKQILNTVETNSYFPEVKQIWEDIIKTTYKESEKSISPLLTTTWDQLGAYNDYCPGDTPVGCVATAMAQIMNYWEFPATGVSEHHYTDPDWGYLSADFSTGNYDWANMPDNTGNNAIALLMYHCGIAVDMDYDAAGSGSQIYDAAMAMANYFKYDQTTMDFVKREDYSDTEWINLLKSELDASRPVLYAGFSTASGGHAFVFDGYNSSDWFHVNWGWSGSYNGYFTVGSLNPGSYDFNDGNQALIGIRPSAAGTEKFYMVKKYSAFPSDTSEYPSYIDGVNEQIAWAIGADGSGDGQDFTDFKRTVNGGIDWNGATVTTDAAAFSMICGLNADTAYISAYGTGASNHVLRTYDGGATWTPVLNGAGASSFFNVVHFFNANDGFSQGDPESGEFELYTTTDGGDTWTRVNGANIPDPLNGEYGIVGHYTAVGNSIWFTTNKGRVYYSADKGYTWDVSTIYSGSYTTYIEVAFGDGGLNGLALVNLTDGSNSTGNEYYKTTDGGLTWTQITPAGNAYYGGISSVPGKPNTFVSVGSDYQTPYMGVSMSVDGGMTWVNTPSYYQDFQMIGLDFVSVNKGYIGTFRGDYTGGMFTGTFDFIFPSFSQVDALNNTDLFCTNTDITFTDESSGDFDTYNWDFGIDATPATGTGTGPFNVQYSSAGNKTVTLNISNTSTGESNIYLKNITVTGVIPADIDTIYGAVNSNNTTEIYSVTNQTDVTFNWSLSSPNWSGESTTNTIEVTFNNGDTGTISTYAENGCGQGAEFVLSVTSTVSIEDIKSGITVYPNPASDYIILKGFENKTFEIFNMSGQIIFSKEIKSQNEKTDISAVKTGSYIIRVSDKSKSYTGKLIIN